MPKRKSDKLEQWFNQGWAPASYKHLHPELKQAIRDIGFRPGIKECYKNCQFLALGVEGGALERRLEYHEGIILTRGIPIQHAWLKLDGEIQDPTVSNACPDEYVASNQHTVVAIRANMVKTGHWCAVDQRALNSLLVSWCTQQKSG